MKKFTSLYLPLLGGALVSLSVFACSSSDEDPATGSGGASSSGGASNSGGTQASGGGGAKSSGGTSTSSGGASTGTGGSVTADVYKCFAATPRDPGTGAGKAGDECCTTEIGKVGKCTAEADIADPIQKAAFGYDTCSKAAGLKCAPAPEQLATAEENGVYEACSTVIGAGAALEGRCLPKCFVLGVGAAAQLKQETCKSADLICAPCYNPIDGTDTGACKQKAGDAPKDPKPAQYKVCGDNLGICVPEVLVTDPAQKTALQNAFADKPSGCATGELCAPTLKAKDQAACFPKCKSTADLDGACVPTFLVPTEQQAAIIQSTCGTGELCAPCLNPLEGNAETGACN